MNITFWGKGVGNDAGNRSVDCLQCRIVDENGQVVPRNATGKIEKPALRKKYGAEQLVA